MIDVGQAVAYLDLDASKFTSGFNSALADLKIFKDEAASVGDKITAVGDGMFSVGKTMTMGFTVPLIGAGAASTKFAADFESGVAKVSTIADTAVMSVEEIGDGVKGIAEDVGISTNELNEGLYELISANGDTANSMAYLETAAQLAKGGFTDVNTAVNGVTSVMNAYGMEGEEAFRKVADIMIETQNVGKTTAGELAASLYNVIPIASAAGVSFEEVSAGLAAITAQGTPTSVATTQMRAAIQAFIKPNTEMAIGLGGVVEKLIQQGKITGANAEAFADLAKQAKVVNTRMADLEAAGKTNTKEFKELQKQSDEYAEQLNGLSAEMGIQVLEAEGLQGSLNLLGEATGYSENQMGIMLGSVEAVQAALSLTSEDGAVKFQDSMNAIQNSSGATTEAFDTMQNTTKGAFEQLKASGQTLAISFGELLLPVLNTIVGWLQDLVDWLNSLDEGTKNTIVTIAAIVAAIGPLLMIMGKVVSAIGTIQTALGAASGPVGWIMLAVAAIAALVAIFSDVKTNAELFGESFAAAVDKISSYGEKLSSVQADLGDLSTYVNDAGETIESLQSRIDTAEQAITDIYTTQLQAQGILRDEDVAAIQGYLTQIEDAESQKYEIILSSVNAQLLQFQYLSDQHHQFTEGELAQMQVDIGEGYTQANAMVAEALDYRLLLAQQARENGDANWEQMVEDANAWANDQYAIIQNATQNSYTQLNTYYENWNETEAALYDSVAEHDANIAELRRQRAELESQFNAGLITDKEKYNNDMAYLNSQEELEMSLRNGNMFHLMQDYNLDAAEAYLSRLIDAKNHGYELSEQEKINVANILNAWDNMPDDMKEAGTEGYQGLISGMTSLDERIAGVAEGSADEIIDTLKSVLDIHSPSKVTHGFGQNVGQGLIDGMESKRGSIWDKAVAMANSALNAIKKALGIHSPSKYGRGFGANLGESVGLGLLDMVSYVKDSAQKLGDTAVDALQSDDIPIGYEVSSSGVVKARASAVGIGGTTNNNTFNLYSGQPLSALEAANEFESMVTRLAEGV